jgi:hypothetical protein
MPYNDPDPGDPSVLVGVGLSCSEKELREMAASFAAELAEIGYDEDRILGIFQKPFYAGPHMAWRQLGETQIRVVVSEAVEFWSHCKVVVKDNTTTERPPHEPDQVEPVVERRR